jgi:hypothetical protein
MHSVQICHPVRGRRVALVHAAQDALRLLRAATLYECVQNALTHQTALEDELAEQTTQEELNYTEIYAGASEWKLLPPFDHPEEPARCLVTGTGLTHRKGAANRNAMHQGEGGGPPVVTDSMRIYQWGEEGGKPAPGQIGVQPEWFYKGTGAILRAHGEPLEVPSYAEDGGEEPEVAGVYCIDALGTPRRLGFVIGNEFSDHCMERRNYLYLAPSKLRVCSLGPELALNAGFEEVRGEVRIERNGETLWAHEIATGQAQMVHSLENLEYHHFKYAAHRRPGDVHIHFFGTGAFSFGAGITLKAGDVMVVDIPVLGRALRNPLQIAAEPPAPVAILPI